MSCKSTQGFQIGDKLRPQSGYSQSLYWKLNDLEEVTVIKVSSDNPSRLVVRCTKGQTVNRNTTSERYDPKLATKMFPFPDYDVDELQRHWSQYGFIVNDAHFELATRNIDDYGIF